MPTHPSTAKTETSPDFLSMLIAIPASFAGTALLFLLVAQVGRFV
jgi:hypothetical protein